MNQILKIDENVALAPLTTLNVGGAARFFAEVESEQELVDAVEFSRERGLPVFVLGGGSNVLVADRGFDGLVIRIANRGIAFDGPNVTAAAGEDWDEFCGECVDRGLAGIECLSGIPGTVGGTPVQNVGAYGQEVSETIVVVRALDLETDRFIHLSNADCRFAYRASVFNTTRRGRYIVTAVTFQLVPNGAPKIAYRDLQDRFKHRSPTLGETREAVRAIRSDKGMLVRQGGPDSNSAGSFFKNPVVTREQFAAVAGRAEALGIGDVPHFDAGRDSIKIPAAWLIEKSGFPKGFRAGNAGISTRHTLALTNRGGATAGEIIALKEVIAGRVRDEFGVDLVPEPIFVGFV